MKLKRFLAAAAISLLLPFAAQAAKPLQQFSPQDQADIARAQAYINDITTLKARFLQVAPTGASAEGTAYLSRPGKLRLDYDPPSQVEVIADGRFLIYHDGELKQTSWLGLDATPAGILVRPNVQFNGKDVTVTKVRRAPGVVTVTLVQAEDPGAGQMTLVFQEAPFELKQWQVVDAQGQLTSVSLFDARSGVKLDPKLFEFKDPNFANPQFNQK